jgi:hypothetical protein
MKDKGFEIGGGELNQHNPYMLIAMRRVDGN